jgi:hypothetical protein
MHEKRTGERRGALTFTHCGHGGNIPAANVLVEHKRIREHSASSTHATSNAKHTTQTGERGSVKVQKVFERTCKGGGSKASEDCGTARQEWGCWSSSRHTTLAHAIPLGLTQGIRMCERRGALTFSHDGQGRHVPAANVLVERNRTVENCASPTHATSDKTHHTNRRTRPGQSFKSLRTTRKDEG